MPSSNTRQDDVKPTGPLQQPLPGLAVSQVEPSRACFSWADEQVDKLSMEKLEDIIRLSEIPNCEVDEEFLEAVITELLCRRSGFHY